MPSSIAFDRRTVTCFLLGCILVALALVGRWNFSRLFRPDSDSLIALLDARAILLSAAVILSLGLQPNDPTVRAPSRRAELWAYSLAAMFLAYMLFSVFWSPDLPDATKKAFDLVCVLLMFIIGRRLTLTPEFAIVERGVYLCLLGLCSALGLIAIVIGGGHLYVLGGGRNVFSRLFAVGALCGLHLPRFTVAGYAIAAMFAILVVLSGSRGGLLAGTIAFTAWFLHGSKFQLRTRMITATFLAVLVFCGVEYTNLGANARSVFQHRVLELTFKQRHTSARDRIYKSAFGVWQESPFFGCGLGGFSIEGGISGISYPHNIFLEAASEGGAIAFGLLFASQVLAAVHFVRNRERTNPLYMSIWILYLVTSQFSGDIFDSRNVFLFMVFAFHPGSSGRRSWTNMPTNSFTSQQGRLLQASAIVNH